MTANTSFKGRNWQLNDILPGPTKAIAALGASRTVAGLLAGRGLDPRDYPDFKAPLIRNLMPDPHFFLDMREAIEHIAGAMVEGRRIGIWSDYDVDGATSAGILGWFLRMSGHDDFVVRIPDRITEGYGPNTPGLLAMFNEQGCRDICILDSGTLAFEPLAAARAAGIDVVVIDHHAAEATVPEGVAIVNPNRKDQEPGFGHLCAAGMTFVFAVGLARRLRELGFYKKGVPDLMELLDMVALGTVCDVVPLTGLNRAFVSRGLIALSKRLRPGITELARAAGIKDSNLITAGDCGWTLGPRINAGGRIGESDSGALLLLEQDPAEARVKAERLNALNVERQQLEAGCTSQAMADIGAREEGDRRLALAITTAHEGVVGISASRVKDSFDAPAIVLTETHEGDLKGSARSVRGFDIGHAIIASHRAGLILKGGGHGMAGGLTLRRDQVKDFVAFMNKEIEASEYFTTGVVARADAELEMRELTLPLLGEFEEMAPFGTGNPQPEIILKSVRITEIRPIKAKHMKLTLQSGSQSIDAMLWGAIGTDLGRMIERSRERMIDVLGRPEINEFRGQQKIQMIVSDLRYSRDAIV